MGIFVQTNTNAQDGVIAACSGGAVGEATGSTQLQKGGTAGTTERTVTIAKGNTDIGFTLQSAPNWPSETSWPSGNYVVRLNVTTANSNITWEDCYVCRVNSSGVNQETIGSLTAQAISCGTTGVKTMTVSGSATTAAATDEIYIVCLFKNGDHMSSFSIGITPDQNVDVPQALGTITCTGIASAEAFGSHTVQGPPVIRYVNTGSTAGGDGTTNATSGSNRAYATLSEAESQVQSETSNVFVTCMGTTADATAVVFSGGTWPSLTIQTDDAESNSRHQGVYSTSFYHMVVDSATNINISQADITIDGIQIAQPRQDGTDTRSIFIFGGDTTIKNCIIKHTTNSANTGTNVEGIVSSSNAVKRIYNNIIYDIQKEGTGTNDGIGIRSFIDSEDYYYHNTVENCDVGMTGTTSTRYENNLVTNCTTASSGTPHGDSNYNVTDGGSIFGSNAVTSASITYDGAEDFHISPASTDAQVANNLYSDANIAITDDIDDGPRPSTGDVFAGADEPPIAPTGIASAEAFGTAKITLYAVVGTGIASAEALGSPYIGKFPTIRSSASDSTSANTTHTLLLPATVEANDLLVVYFAVDGNPTITWDSSTTGQWSLRDRLNNGSEVKIECWMQVADGTEDGKSLSITTDATQHSRTFSIAIKGWDYGDGSLSAIDNAIALSDRALTQTAVDPTSLSPAWGQEDTLWIQCTAVDNTTSFNGNSSDGFNVLYTQDGASADDVGLQFEYQQNRVATYHPSNFNLSASEDWATQMFAIKPYPDILPTGIASAEAFGSHDVALGTGGQTITCTGIASAEAFGTAQLDQNIVCTGIASAEAFGALSVSARVAPTGIASAEAFGTAQLNQNVVATGIASAEAFGTTQLNQSVVVTGIASAEAFGTTSLIQIISVTGISSTEAFGTAQLNQNIVCTGIASAEAFGATSLVQVVSVTGIASAEAFGTAQLDQNIVCTGITSAEAFGTAQLNQNITCTGIASAEAFGIANISAQISVSSITSAEAFGTAQLDLELLSTGIASAEAFGTAQLDLNIVCTGITSAEAFGSHALDFSVNLSPSSITSAEAFGSPALSLYLLPSSITSAEAFGTAQLNQNVVVTGIASAEAFGTTSLIQNITATGIASAEAFGAHTLAPGAVNISLTSIASAEAFGTAQLDQSIVVTGIASAEAFGTHDVAVGVINLSPTGIASTEAFGTAQLNLSLISMGVPSAEAFGTTSLVQIIQTTGISSAEAFGTAQLNQSVVATGIASAEAFGAHTLAPGVVDISPSAITSAEAFGVPSLAQNISCTGIASAEAFGTAQLDQAISCTGIASAETFGSVTVASGFLLLPSGIASTEAFGAPTLGLYLLPTGISSAEAFGALSLAQAISCTGIASAEVLGAPALSQDVTSMGVASAEAFGSHTVETTTQFITIDAGISSNEAFGAAQLDMSISCTGIASAEVFGTTRINQSIACAGIASIETFGSHALSPGAVDVSPTGIASTEAFGTTQIDQSVACTGIASAETFGTAQFNFGITLVGISSIETFGATVVGQSGDIFLTGIASAEAFGTALIFEPSDHFSFEAHGRSYLYSPEESSYSFIAKSRKFSFTPESD